MTGGLFTCQNTEDIYYTPSSKLSTSPEQEKILNGSKKAIPKLI